MSKKKSASSELYALRYMKDGMLREFPMKRFKSIQKAEKMARDLAKHNSRKVYVTQGRDTIYIAG